MDEALPITGERTVPGVASENYWFRRHEAVYEHLGELVVGQRVVEVGCGEGYGTALLATRAVTVLGIDYDHWAIEHAARSYPTPSFVRANLAHLPIANESADVVVSLQVIEHVWDHPQFLDECRRVLRPGGTLILSTPNRLTFSPDHDEGNPPRNPYHTFEFTSADLAGLLSTTGWHDIEIEGLYAQPRLAAFDEHWQGFAQAQLATAPEYWPDELRADVASVTVADFALRAGPADTSLDLVARCRRLG